jgi:hypothetical protein
LLVPGVGLAPMGTAPHQQVADSTMPTMPNLPLMP